MRPGVQFIMDAPWPLVYWAQPHTFADAQRRWLYRIGKEETPGCHASNRSNPGGTFIYLFIALNPKAKSYGRARVLEAPSPMLVAFREAHSGRVPRVNSAKEERREVGVFFGAVYAFLSDFENFDVTSYSVTSYSLLTSSS